MLTYPKIDPIAIDIGPIPVPWYGPASLQIRWYGLMYLFGIVAGWMLMRYRARRPHSGGRGNMGRAGI